MQNPNAIVLDEPTAHLDLESITAFNNGAVDFPGVVLLSTHDLTFAKTTCNRVIEFLEDGVRDFIGNYEEFLEKKKEELKAI